MRPLQTISDEALQSIIDESNSISQILRTLKLSETCPYSRRTLKEKMKSMDCSKFEDNKKNTNPFYNGFDHQISDEEYFSIGNARRTGQGVKLRLIKHKGWENKCVICHNPGEWMGKPLSLHLDHINGNCFDNRLENLRIICPNCHSQTDTFGARNIKREEKEIKKCKCGKEISNESTTCKSCIPRHKKIVWPSDDELAKLVWKKSLASIGRELGVNANSVRKYCIKQSIDRPPFGYFRNRK